LMSANSASASVTFYRIQARHIGSVRTSSRAESLTRTGLNRAIVDPLLTAGSNCRPVATGRLQTAIHIDLGYPKPKDLDR
jgi:hypothetical protein